MSKKLVSSLALTSRVNFLSGASVSVFFIPFEFAADGLRESEESLELYTPGFGFVGGACFCLT